MYSTIRPMVFIIHGYKSYPNDCWFPWLKKELEKRKFRVVVMRLPNPQKPKKKLWIASIKNAIKRPNKNIFLVGHSLGSIAILRYFETLKRGENIGGMINIAGRLIRRKGNSKHPTANFFSTPISWNKIKKHCNTFVGIYSIDDPIVSIENGYQFKKNLNAKLIIEKDKGHFARDDKVFKLPVLLNILLKMSD